MRAFFQRWWQSGGLRQYFLVYTIIFIIMVLCVFGVFFINGKSFIWGMTPQHQDGYSQHYLALVYYAQWLRSILQGIFIDHSFEIPSFNFSLGYGSDVTTTLHYYAIGDPLTVFSALVPTRFMAAFYNFLIILRLYLAGIAFSLFCFYALPKIVSREKSDAFPKTAILTGTFIYVFCGFALLFSVRDPYFINPMIYFPLLLLGVEWILAKKKPVLFVVMAFICTVSNFYFLYMLVILTILYVVWRLCSLYSRGQLRLALLMFGKIAGYALLGMGLGAVMLIPVVSLFLGDVRSDSGYIYDPLYSIGYYEQNFSAFLAQPNRDWTVMGYAAVALIAAFLLFIQKGNRNFKIAFIVLTVMELLPVAGSIMNGFSYVSNRWIWGYSFLIGCIVVLKWRAIFELSVRERWWLVLCLVAYFLVCYVFIQYRSIATFFAIAMAFISLALIALANERFGVHIAQIILVVCVLFNITGNALFTYLPPSGDEEDHNYLSEFADSTETMTGLKQTEAPAIKEASAGDDDFFRYSGSLMTRNNALYSGLHSTQYYWSLGNGNVADFQSELALSSEILPQNIKTLDSRTFLSTLANVEYYVQDSDLPYGYSLIDTYKLGYESKSKKHQLWENDNFLPFGYTYDSYISRTDYDAMSPLEKQEALLQGCVIDDSNVQGEQANVANSGTSVPYEVKAGKGCSLEGNTVTVTKAGAKLNLTFDGLEDAETYLYITGLNYAGISPRDMYTDEEWDDLSVYEKNQVNFENIYWEEDTKVNVDITAADASEEKNSSAVLTYYTPESKYYYNRSDFMVNLAYDEEAKVSMTLSFRYTGVYSFDSMEVLCQPMDNYEQQVEALAQDTLQNVDFHENRAHATNQVSGTISLDSAKYLLLTIPYSSGWSAYVDGKPQELLQANTAFMALYLEPGDHEINLVYHTPGSTAGLIISLLSLAVAIALIILGRLRRVNGVEETQKPSQGARSTSQPTQPLRPVRARSESIPQVARKGTGQSVNSHQRAGGYSQIVNPRASSEPHKRKKA